MRFSVLGFRSDIRIELQAPVHKETTKLFQHTDYLSLGLLLVFLGYSLTRKQIVKIMNLFFFSAGWFEFL